MPTFANIDGEESGTVTFTVGAVSLTRNSSAELQEILCLGDPDISTNIARVTSVPPNSTMAGVAVRIIGGPSTFADFPVRAVLPSTATDNPVSFPSTQSVQVKNSTIGDLLASVQQNSTVWAVQVDGRVRAQNSTIGDLLASVQQNSTVWAVQVDGRVRAQNSTIGDLLASVQQNSTVWAVQVDGRVRAQNSTIGDLLASVQQNSTVWQTQAAVRTSSGGSVEGSTTSPSTGVLGLHVRPVQPSGRQSTSVLVNMQTAGGSTTLISSAAAPLRHFAFAYSVMSTITAVSSFAFLSSGASERWGGILGSQSSGITGANLAVAPPGFLFATDPNNALTFTASSTGLYRVSLSWFTEA